MSNLYVKIEDDGTRNIVERPKWFYDDGEPVDNEWLIINENMYEIVEEEGLNDDDNISIIENDINDWILTEYNIIKTNTIIKDRLPDPSTYDTFHQFLELKPEEEWDVEGNITYRTYNILTASVDDIKNDIISSLSAYRYDVEVGGILYSINDTQYILNTDRESKSNITSKLLSFESSEITSINWKFQNGFVAMNYDEFKQLSNYVNSFTQLLYDNEMNILNQINNTVSYDTLKQIFNDGVFNNWDPNNISIFLNN